MGSRTIRVSAGLALAVFLLTHIALADDAVGLVRVDAGTNGVVETEMPFSPIGDSGPVRGSTRIRGFPPSCRHSPAMR